MSSEPNQALLQRFVDGDREAFEVLFRAFENEVYRWIHRIVRDESLAEDGVVDAFWRCYRSRARFDPTRSFGAWMRRIATRVALDLSRTARRHRSTVIRESDTTSIGAYGNEAEARRAAEAEAGRAAEADAIRRVFDALPQKLRVVATLALIEERTHEEIAAALGVPLGTVKSRLFRARRKLRRELERIGVNI